MRALLPIAIILLVAVFMRHGSIYWLADLSGFPPGAVNVMLGGAFEIALAAVIAFLIFGYAPGIWRNLGLGACLIAAIEGAQITGCRAFVANIRLVPPKTDLCDYLVGFPIGRVIIGLELAIVCYALAAALRKG